MKNIFFSALGLRLINKKPKLLNNSPTLENNAVRRLFGTRKEQITCILSF